MHQNARAFPVGLYGMLLFALCWLTLPTLFAPLERLLVGGACAVPRWWAGWFGTPVAAAAVDPASREQRLAVQAALHERLREVDTDDGGGHFDNCRPVHCAVVATARTVRQRAGNEPNELLLDHSYAELHDCREFVTKGDVLVGRLLRPGQGLAALDRPEDPARVQLLHHPSASPLYATMELGDGAMLRLVVRGAGPAEPAPLRVDLWDDPYRASSIGRSGLPVRTTLLPGDAACPPLGLTIGASLVWGYPQQGDERSLLLGVFVQPPFTARALSHVVLWREARPGDPSPVANEAEPVRRTRRPGLLYDLPGAAAGRHLLVVEHLANSATVVRDGHLVGTARGLAFGTGLVTSFPASRQRWSLLLLPDDRSLPPLELDGEVVAAEQNVAHVRVQGHPHDRQHRLPAGQLFTGSNGWHCPSGLSIGHALPVAGEPDVLRVTAEFAPGPLPVDVIEGGRP